jgi:hypothetical protein
MSTEFHYVVRLNHGSDDFAARASRRNSGVEMLLGTASCPNSQEG